MGVGAAGGAGALLYKLYPPTAFTRKAASIRSTDVSSKGQFPVQFSDVTRDAGICFQHNSGAFGKKYLPETLGAGCAFFDYDNDGWLDVLLVNGMDWPGHKRQRATMKLYRNNRNGTFSETAVMAGVAFSEDGVARAGMGADAADYDNSGLPSLVVTNFSQQMVGLYRNEGHGFFVDEAPQSAVGKSSRLTLGFGCFFFDVDLDGRLDLLVANGHIDETITRVESTISYAESPHLFHNEGGGKFRDVVALVGKAFNQPKVARGAAYGDFDNDGDLDVLITTNNGPAYLFRNDCAANHSIRFRTVGAKSNHDGIGANIRIWTPEGVRWLTVKSGSSYLSQSDRSVTFGLGGFESIERAAIEWPSGLKQELGKLAADHTYVVEEGKGIVADVPHRRP